ncbi:hypothetical protein LTR10_014255 [Elasticomyces elasticus]|uniref:DUF4045 domain-containing protein n=1 Tax=Exophiala sideris TaxID=1016849 RepID=A0ABR0JIR0_9EURO|nr:hypothetical protein LTR10_014255 [Elasticomyces elasticus]KAK5034295.1 hypothetical protein LTS07_003215 [Exophiala sideris]KAK5042592.1 hypothetical protein LTR13_001439 [Exophiala sideris]KAK5065674.1 hypothetical protein LTR69_003223 [Exophiala sideris]
MGFWPFSGRKKGRASHTQNQGSSPSTEEGQTDTRPGVSPSASEDLDAMARGQNKRPQEGPRRLSKQRTPSGSGNVSRAQTTPVPGTESWNRRDSPAMGAGTGSGPNVYSQNPMSKSSIGPEDFTALPPAPTLMAKRGQYDPTLTRRKSSKRKAEDHAREREIRAMSSPDPLSRRPSSYSGSGPLRRDTKEVPGDLNRKLQRPNSKVTLPLPEVIQESEDVENAASFKIGILAALSPRPTLTYVSNPRTSAGKQPARIKPSVEKAIEEEAPTSRKRIDDLADDLDAGGLRELMERDRRRHEKKKATDRERLQRKLQRKADRQREEELRGRQLQEATSSPLGPGTGGGERRGAPVESGIESPIVAAARVSPSPRGRATEVYEEDGAAPSAWTRPTNNTIRNPFEDETDIDLMIDPFAHEEEEGPAVPVRSPLRTVSPVEIKTNQQPSHATTISPPTSPVQRPSDRQSFSQTSGLGREITPDVPEQGQSERRASDQSSQRQLSSWTSFFKRGTRRKRGTADRGRSTPSEFSNTSRESFARKQQLPPVVVPRTFRRSDSSGVPQRTMSKFREDLPEFPISPPDSRVQSPEATTGPQIGGPQHSIRQSQSGTLDDRSLATASSSAVLDRGPGDPRSFDTEEDELAQDEYLSTLSPGPDMRRESVDSAMRRASSTVIDLERERQQSPVPEVPPLPAGHAHDETWHAGLGRQATVVRQANRAKSKEGLLKEYGTDSPEGSRKSTSDEDDSDSDTEALGAETPGAELQEAPILRARSVEYKGHARHISAGSARLLDIRRASSVHSDGPQRSPGLPQTPRASAIQFEQQASANIP